MRSLQEIVAELNHEIGQAEAIVGVIAVGFKSNTEMVSSEEGLEKLTRLVKAGGQPMGIILAIKDKVTKTLVVRSRKLREWKDDSWVDEYLEKLGKSMEAQFAQMGAQKLPPPENN
jgi:hypothetical protein